MNILLAKILQEIILSTLSDVKNSNDVQKYIIQKIRVWIKSLEPSRAQIVIAFIAENIANKELSRTEWANLALKANDSTNTDIK